MSSKVSIQVRIDKNIKEQASKILEKHYGLSVSEAVRMLLTETAASKRLPFSFDVPNAKTRAAMREADRIIAARHRLAATMKE